MSTNPVPPFRPDPLPDPAADRSWVTEETIGSSAREDAWFAAIMAFVFVTFVAFIVWFALDGAAENRRVAPHEDRCLLSNGRVVHLNDGDACLVDGRVTDRWSPTASTRPTTRPDMTAHPMKGTPMNTPQEEQQTDCNVNRSAMAAARQAGVLAEGHAGHGCAQDDTSVKPAEAPNVPSVHSRACVLDDCDRPFHARGLCRKHYLRSLRRGSTMLPPKERTPGYETMHRRVRAERGPASLHMCTDCDEQAQDWSYDNQDPDELFDTRIRCAFSLDTAHYQPRCKLCHAEFDLAERIRRNPPPPEKACTKCGVVKALEEFPRDARLIDGRCARCKVCDRAAVAARENRRRKGDRRSRPELLEEIARLNQTIDELRGSHV